MAKKVTKIILITLICILIPALIMVAVLYANDKDLLIKFQNWLHSPNNVTAFIVGIGLYFPFLNGLWKLVMNIIAAINQHKLRHKNKINKIKIYDDDKNNYIYYDQKNNILDCQFKANEDVNIDKFVDMIYAELKEKTKTIDNQSKIKE